MINEIDICLPRPTISDTFPISRIQQGTLSTDPAANKRLKGNISKNATNENIYIK